MSTINNNSDQHLRLSDPELQLLDQPPVATREARLDEIQQLLEQPHPPAKQAELALEAAGLLLDLDRKAESASLARQCVAPFIEQQRFEDAAMACQYVYLADEHDALPAIGQAAWLSVTYPVDPHLTANILDHIVDETPDDSDGAAVAAATAHYVADLRGGLSGNEQEKETLVMFTGAMLARVAKRHSGIDDDQQFNAWVSRLELDEPDKFLVRLRNVIDVLVQTDWWFDREALQQEIPE